MPTPRNPNRTALMLDIETLGRTPGSVIFQIGAIRFDPETFIFEDTTFVEICPESCRCHGLTTDPETIAWWQTRNLDPNTLKGTILPKALDTLTSFITSTPEPENIWCNGTSFDFPLLEAAYRATSKTPPWQYWQQRDLRTLWNLAFPGQKPQTDASHNALDDCTRQIAMLEDALNKLNTQITDH